MFRANSISTDFIVRTLTPSLTTHRHKTAIATFSRSDPGSPTKLLDSNSAARKISLPCFPKEEDQQDFEIEDETPESINIDDKFLSFTLLSAPKVEDHKQE